MALITMDEVRNRIQTRIPKTKPYCVSEVEKLENIQSFNDLSRTNLEYGIMEKRILLYETACGEKVYMQFPGSESVRATNAYPLDARPVLQKRDGSFSADMDFKKIWDVIDRIGQAHPVDIDILATIFLRVAYMLEYEHHDEDYPCETIDIISGRIVSNSTQHLVWNALSLDSDVLETISDRFGTIGDISLESFLYYNDLLAQNEDCKYYFRKGENWKLSDGAGRINNCLSHLTVISHIRGKIGISKLIDSFQRTGVAPLPQSRLSEACGDLVIRG